MYEFLAIGGGWVKAGQLLLALSILIVLHEFGHFITAKWFGCRVEKFYLFFDPWFSLFKKKKGETEYGIGWLPLGGYVKISGMIDESMDKETMAQPPKPYEFRSKPAWQRLIIMLGGVIMNVLVAFIIYALVLYKWGETKIPMESLKYGLGVQNKELLDLGLKSGDKILAVNGKPVQYFNELAERLLIGTSDRVVDLERDGKKTSITIPINFLNKVIENKKRARAFILPRVPAIITGIDSAGKSPAYKAGLKDYDRIIAVDSMPINFFDEIATALTNKKDKPVTITVVRNADTVKCNGIADCNAKLGLGILSYQELDSIGILKMVTTKYGFAEAFPAGVKKTVNSLSSYIDQFKMIFKPETGAYKGLGGFKGMANALPSVWDWETFWTFTAFISIVLAFMNLLPIPALDGGHVMFTLYEMIFRRKPNEKFLEYAQLVGMVLLFGLMIYANGNDWFGWGKSVSTDCPVK
jgi:regulator of sigma E protease